MYSTYIYIGCSISIESGPSYLVRMLSGPCQLSLHLQFMIPFGIFE